MNEHKLEKVKKNRFIKKHPNLTSEQKEELILLYSRQFVPDNIVDWNIFNSFSYQYLKDTMDGFLKNRKEKKDKGNLSKAIEGRDYIKLFENKNSNGTEYLYLPLTWIGSKYLASDHFLPKIKVPSKQMNARDFSDNTAKNDELSPGAKWCISLWTLPDLVIMGKPFTDENGKELRHEGKVHWLSYTSMGYYFLFYFRNNKRVKDIYKKIAFTLKVGDSKIRGITLADDTVGKRTSSINRVQEYWNEHYKEYESQIEHIQEVSEEEYPNFKEYEKQRKERVIKDYHSYIKEGILRDYFIYNESTGRYDSKESLYSKILQYLVEDGEFTVPIGVINGIFDCRNLHLRTLKNGPTEVTGTFCCHENELTTLEGAPKKVGGYFYCGLNLLKSLEGAPKYVGRDFDCSYNQLTSLKGAPKEIGGSFYCMDNSLNSLEGAPLVVNDFCCYKNKLTTLKGVPRKIKGSLDCASNQLTSLEGVPNKIEGNFYCQENNLTSLKDAPNEIGGNFYCYGNKLTSLEGAPKKIGKKFSCYSNKLISLKYAPQKVGGDFVCSQNRLRSLKGAPQKIKGYFECSQNELESLEYAPIEVKGGFNCSYNMLTSLEYAPKTVGGWFDCSYNQITSLSNIPNAGGQYIDCSYNPLQSKGIPLGVRGTINLRGTPYDDVLSI